jgi:hypothetical protein
MRKLGERLLEFLYRGRVVATLYRRHNAGLEVVFEDHLPGGLERSANRGDLRQHLRAVAIGQHHLAYTAHVSFNSRESSDYLIPARM